MRIDQGRNDTVKVKIADAVSHPHELRSQAVLHV
jgi:hypothetical protein